MKDDAVEVYVTTMADVLHGPARLRNRMLTELRDGLADMAEAVGSGERAVREFGTVAQLAPGFQRELTIAQARRTALAVAVTVPLLIACWSLVGDASIPRPAQLVTAHLGGVAATTALLAVAALAVTGRLARLRPSPDRLPLVVAWSGTAAGTALAVSAVTMVVGSVLGGNWPLAGFAAVLTIVAHARLAASARACRRCARLVVHCG